MTTSNINNIRNVYRTTLMEPPTYEFCMIELNVATIRLVIKPNVPKYAYDILYKYRTPSGS